MKTVKDSRIQQDTLSIEKALTFLVSVSLIAGSLGIFPAWHVYTCCRNRYQGGHPSLSPSYGHAVSARVLHFAIWENARTVVEQMTLMH